MKKILTYTILAACILALSACNEKLSEPAWEPEKTTEPIGFSSGVAKTKGLIENTDANPDALAKNSTRIQVYDILTSADNAVSVTYINDVIQGVDGNNNTIVDGEVVYAPWAYVSQNSYYWTKTGTHKFFGWLTQGPGGTSDIFTGKAYWNDNSKTLQVGSGDTGTGFLKLLPATSTFDFLYSDIIIRNAATDSHDPIALDMQHLFTALSVEVSNQTGAQVSGLSVVFANLLSDRKATISYTANTSSIPDPSYVSSDTQDATMSFGQVTEFESSTFVPLYTTDPYRLLWPQNQTAFSSATLTVAFTIPDPNDAEAAPISVSKIVALTDIFKNITEMEAGHRYLLQITILIDEMRFAVTVNPLVNMNKPGGSAEDNNNEHFYVES